MATKQSLPPSPMNPMNNHLVKFLPLLAIAIGAPAIAASNHFERHSNGVQIADNEMGRRENRLNLTPAQKAKMQQIEADTRSQIDAVLTSSQRQQLAQLQTQRQAERQGGKGMDLTADQKTKLKAIRESNKAQFRAILTPAQQAQLGQGSGWGKGGMERLELTAEQKTKMQQLQASARSQMEAILTPEQQQQATARQERRQAMRNSWKSLNLTADQKAKIKTIRQSSKQQLDAILTPEQQAQRKSHHRSSGGKPNSI